MVKGQVYSEIKCTFLAEVCWSTVCSRRHFVLYWSCVCQSDNSAQCCQALTTTQYCCVLAS